MNRKNKISTGNFKNAISIKPDDMLNVRSFTIPTNYTLFKSIDDKGNAVEQYYTLKYWTLENDTTKYELGNTYSPLFHWEPVACRLLTCSRFRRLYPHRYYRL